jgi:hypothetical protein
VTIGGFTTKYLNNGKNESDITWNDLSNTNYWSVSLVAATVGTSDIVLSTKTAIVDTGTSYLLMPTGKRNYLRLIDEI